MKSGLLALLLIACGDHHDNSVDAPVPTGDGPIVDADPGVCSTRITYGATWISAHPAQFDDVMGEVTWDGTCTDDGANSYATLSNGFKPYFTGHSSCVIALDETPACANVAPKCATRITYGTGWLPAANHPNSYDDVNGRVYGDGTCTSSFTTLSNGFAPHYSGSTCPISWRYEQCGGLYTNPDIPHDCPDPGVLKDGNTYYLSCTSGGAAQAFPIYTSTDLANWSMVGHIFPTGTKPTWATGDFWAPEIHKVGANYVAYFSARNTDGKLSIGAAMAPTAMGPFTDLGQPLIHDANMGLIDASEFTTSAGVPYVLWKEDGNAVGKPTPIHIAPLNDDGMSLKGAASTLITNDKAWEGAVTEGPFMVEHDGMYYLFYSGNSYTNGTYAVGVARGTSLTAMMTKPADPILVTNDNWTGPGHCSVVDAPGGGTAMVYHAWEPDCVNQAGCGREVLTDSIAWDADGWPQVPLSPSRTTRPLP
ncbi:MAG: glycoside hydrolase family 43 protein [Kofleriaceae bacterium]